MDSKFEVVISGISGKFPECNNVPSFIDALHNGTPLISTKNDRWPIDYRYKSSDQTIPAGIGKIKGLRDIDTSVFKINNTTAECTCIANCGVLEPAFEALVDAGVNPHHLNGRCIGVFTTTHHCDTDKSATVLEGARLWVLGSSKTMMANRISFAFNLTGPSMTFYHDINGSFLALNEAYKMISEGFIEAAVVGVVSSAIVPDLSLHLASMNVLSGDSVTRVFDKNANGYGRSDGIVALYLQRAEEAKRIYGTIDFMGFKYYGSNPNTYLGYDQNVLKKCLLDSYSEKNYEGYKDVAFVEMNANGLKRNDRVECNAIADVFCEGRKTPLLVGSVKSNAGNSEGAAPYFSLCKAIYALETGCILPNVNLQQIDDTIEALSENKLKVVTELTELPSDKVAINSIGITGSLSQVVVKRNPKTKTPSEDNLPRLLLICGRTEDGTRDAIAKLEEQTFDTNFISLMNDVFCVDMPFHAHRGYTILSADHDRVKKNALNAKGNKNRPVWFVFSGMGSQWNLMGNGLLDIPIFAETVRKCDDILKPIGVDIYHILTNDDPTIFDNILHSFVGIIVVQIGLFEILKALGIEPDGVIGHSAGENACAYAEGCLTLEQTVISAYFRGIVSLETKTIKGMMAAVGKGYNEIKDSLPPNIEVGCHNSATSCTLSGPTDDVNKFVQQLQEEKVFAKAVNAGNIAYHSKYIAPLAPIFLHRMKKIIPTPIQRSSKWVSTSVPESDWDQPLAKYCSAEYFTNNLVSPVLFEEGCKHIPSDALVIEIAPHGLLQAILKRSLPDTCTNVSLTRRNENNNNLENLLSAIGDIYISGCNVNVNAIYPPTQYPVPRDTPSLAPFATWYHMDLGANIAKLDATGCSPSDPLKIRVNDDSPYSYLKYHRIEDQIILPTSFFLYLTWWVFPMQCKQEFGMKPVVFKDILLLKNVKASLKKPPTFTIYIQKGSGTFEILKLSQSDANKTTQVMTGVISPAEKDGELEPRKVEIPATKQTITGEHFYQLLNTVGYQLGDDFRALQELSYNETDCYATIKWDNNWISFLDAILKLSMFHRNKGEITNLMYTKKIRHLEAIPSQIQSLEKGCTIVCRRNFATDEITCDGVLISGIQNYPYRNTRNKNQANIKLEGLRFVSHQNPRCTSVAEFLNICLQIANENLALVSKQKHSKLNVVVESDDDIAKLLKAVVADSPSLESKVVFWYQEDVLSNQQIMANNCCIIVSDNLASIRGYTIESLLLLILTPNDQSIGTKLEQSFVQVIEQRFDKRTISLYKKRSPSDGGELQTMKLDEDCAMEHALPHGKAETIIKRNTSFEDLSLMLKNGEYPTDHRYMFILDEKMPVDMTLRNQLVQDLPVTVIKQGEWGSYRSVLEEPLHKNKDTKRTTNDFPTDIRLESIQMHYLNSDSKGETEDEIHEYGIEYAGVDVSGEKIMGLSSINKFQSVNKPDANLTWKIPEKWSLEDAATVPSIYANAYNILNLVRGMRPLNKVMINIGNEGLLSLACISLSLQRNCIVYVVVSNDQEADIVHRKFPQIKKSQIFDRRICNYEIEILTATQNLGVDLAINCLSGIEHIVATVNCVAAFGHCVEVANVDDLELHELGLRPFLKSISFVILRNTIATLLKLCDTDKRLLHAHVEEGIESGVVVPFERDVCIYDMPEYLDERGEQNFTKIVHKVTTQNELGCNANGKIQYDGNHSFIIVGGEKEDNAWFELVEWLTTKGARKFVVVVDNPSVNVKSEISHQMNRLLNKKKALITLTSSEKIESAKEASQVVDEANKVAPLAAVFFISVQSADKKIRNMDLATRQSHPHVHFVSMFSGGLKECESRCYKGSPSLVIHGEKWSKKLSAILPHVDDVLQKFDNNNSPILYRAIDLDIADTLTNESTVHNFIPTDILTLECIGGDLAKQDTIEFAEVTTLAPRSTDGKNTTPVFVISALGPKPLRGLFMNLISPAFCTVITNSAGSIAETVSKLYASLNRIQSEEGVTLVTETWWSWVAIEIARLLERDGRKYRLFMIEGNPQEWKERIEALGTLDSPQFESNLVAEVFKNYSKIQTYENVHSPQALVNKIRACLSIENYPSLNFHHLANVVETIYNGLTLASRYQHNENEIVKNTIVLAQRTPSDDKIMNLSITSEIFVHEEDNYYKFVNSRNFSSKINDNIFHNIWYSRSE